MIIKYSDMDWYIGFPTNNHRILDRFFSKDCLIVSCMPTTNGFSRFLVALPNSFEVKPTEINGCKMFYISKDEFERLKNAGQC